MHSLQRESADLLWYAIVGLTDQYVHQVRSTRIAL